MEIVQGPFMLPAGTIHPPRHRASCAIHCGVTMPEFRLKTKLECWRVPLGNPSTGQHRSRGIFILTFRVSHEKPVFCRKTPNGRCGCVALPNMRCLHSYAVNLTQAPSQWMFMQRKRRWLYLNYMTMDKGARGVDIRR